MFSSLFIKLTLVTLGSIGLGTGGYFVYKTFSKEVEETNTTTSNQINKGETINSNGEDNTTEGRRNLDNGNEQPQQGREAVGSGYGHQVSNPQGSSNDETKSIREGTSE